jgi:hypothetical protein
MKPTLSLDKRQVRPLELILRETITRADMAKILGSNVDTSETTPIDLTTIADQFRMQKIIFNTAIEVFERMNPKWPGSKEQLLSQIIAIIEDFLESEKIRIIPEVGYDDVRRLITLVLNMSKIVEHIWNAIEPNNAESTKLVFEDDHRPIGSTCDMIPCGIQENLGWLPRGVISTSASVIAPGKLRPPLSWTEIQRWSHGSKTIIWASSSITSSVVNAIGICLISSFI